MSFLCTAHLSVAPKHFQCSELSIFGEVKIGNLLSYTNNSLQHLGKYLSGKGLTGYGQFCFMDLLFKPNFGSHI